MRPCKNSIGGGGDKTCSSLAMSGEKCVDKIDWEFLGFDWEYPDIFCCSINNEKVGNMSIPTGNGSKFGGVTLIEDILEVRWTAHKAKVHMEHGS